MSKQEKRGSGKQVLLKILEDLSIRLVSEQDKQNATERLRAGLLLHGSTAPESYEHVELLRWGSSVKGERVWRQGIATQKGNVFITDVYEEICEIPAVKEIILEKFKDLDSEDYEACMYAIWLVLSSVQMFEQLLPVETKEKIDIERWVKGLTMGRWHYFNDKESDT